MPKEEKKLRFRLAALEHIVAMTSYKEADVSCLTSLFKLKEDCRVLNFKWDADLEDRGQGKYTSARYFTVTLKSPMENDAVKNMLREYGLESYYHKPFHEVGPSGSQEVAFSLTFLPVVSGSEVMERKSSHGTAYEGPNDSIMFAHDLTLRR
ncbi:MAG: hypothetical protein AABW93_01645 [Nanoarchaeota archaeon]